MLAKSRSIDSTREVDGRREMGFQAGYLLSGVARKVTTPHSYPSIPLLELEEFLLAMLDFLKNLRKDNS